MFNKKIRNGAKDLFDAVNSLENTLFDVTLKDPELVAILHDVKNSSLLLLNDLELIDG